MSSEEEAATGDGEPPPIRGPRVYLHVNKKIEIVERVKR
jgi:hypothetical protein